MKRVFLIITILLLVSLPLLTPLMLKDQLSVMTALAALGIILLLRNRRQVDGW